MKKILLVSLVALLALSLGTAPTDAVAAKEFKAKVGGGPTGGTFNTFANAMAVYVPKNMDGIKVSPVGSGGSVENVKRVSSGESDFGLCRIVTTRWMPQDAVLLLDSSRVNVLPLAGRSFHFKPLASSGDYECGELIGEYTLELRNEAAHGLIRGLATS